MYHIEVSKVIGYSWLFVLVNVMGRLGRSRDRSLPQSSGVQANIEGIHEISQPMCENLQKRSGGLLILRLA